MIAYLVDNIVFDYNSVPLEDISDLDIKLGYVKDSLRIYDNKIYKSATTTFPLVQYIWYDEDSNNIYGRDMYNDIDIPDPTSVSVVNAETVVYVASNLSFYIAKVTGNVDFTTEDIVNPSNFTFLGTSTNPNYSVVHRIEYNYPNGREDTIYWLYESSTNRTTMIDGSLNKQTTNDRQLTGTDISFVAISDTIVSGTEITNIFADDKILIIGSQYNDGEFEVDTIAVDKLSFTIKEVGVLVDESAGSNVRISTYSYIKFTKTGIDKIAFFNVQCEEVEVIVTVDGNETIYNFEMIDTSNITDFETFCFDDENQLNKKILTVFRDYGMEFEITFKGFTQNIGEVIVGSSQYIGKAEDVTVLSGRSYGEILETKSGDVYFDEVDSRLKVVEKVNYTIDIPTETLEFQSEKNKSLLNKRLVISGSEDDEGDLRYLINYGYGKDYRLNAKSTNTNSNYTFEFRSFL